MEGWLWNDWLRMSPCKGASIKRATPCVVLLASLEYSCSWYFILFISYFIFEIDIWDLLFHNTHCYLDIWYIISCVWYFTFHIPRSIFDIFAEMFAEIESCFTLLVHLNISPCGAHNSSFYEDAETRRLGVNFIWWICQKLECILLAPSGALYIIMPYCRSGKA